MFRTAFNYLFGNSASTTSPSQASQPKTFHERLTAIDYDSELLPDSFLDPIHLGIMEKPLKIIHELAANDSKSGMIRAVRHYDYETLNNWLLTQHLHALRAVPEDRAEDEIALKLRYEQTKLESLLAAKKKHREALCRQHELIDCMRARILNVEMDDDIRERIEHFVTCLERIHAIKKHISQVDDEIAEQIKSITPESIVRIDDTLDLKLVGKLIAEQQKEIKESQPLRIRELEIELVGELEAFMAIAQESIIISDDRNKDVHDKLIEFDRIIKPHLELFESLREKLEPLYPELFRDHSPARQSHEPVSSSSSSSSNHHAPSHCHSAEAASHEPSTTPAEMPTHELPFSVETYALFQTDESALSIPHTTSSIFFALVPAARRETILASASGTRLHELSLAERRAELRKLYDYLHRKESGSEPETTTESEVKPFSRFTDATPEPEHALSSPSLPTSLLASKSLFYIPLAQDNRTESRVIQISPSSSPRRNP